MKKQTKLLCFFAFVLLGISIMSLNTFAAQKTDYEQIPIYINGKEIQNAEALLIDSITYVPLRKLAESAYNCKITYNDRTKTATVTIQVKAGKTKPTYITYEKREAAQQNVANYADVTSTSIPSRCKK